MKKNMTVLVGIFILVVIAGVVVAIMPSNKVMAPTNTNGTTTTQEEPHTAGIADLILVDTPVKGGLVASPLTVTGSARGTWYFEASFPVELQDAQGKTIAQVPAAAQSDWMTEDFVNFKATLTFPVQQKGTAGTLILHKDNPSGDPARDQSVKVPVTF